MWEAYPPYVYPGKAYANRWMEGEDDAVRQELSEIITPARHIIIGAVLAELYNSSGHHCQRFVTTVLNAELRECFSCDHQECRHNGRCRFRNA